ncbi:hypothetical protein B4U80_04605 [Leptotrombidium deliense]|uniref:Uncharacterized protein n=1 Tax=Leptotrombidium deliense TaxID=299467 RepID=A0A443SFL7_9ACAR|nr:hypothetical protein B4U80_04605 [Leptotrombidium deliense]
MSSYICGLSHVTFDCLRVNFSFTNATGKNRD